MIMKRLTVFIVVIVIIAGLAGSTFLYLKISSPEYALAKTIKDVEDFGLDGLEKHLTSDAAEKLEAIEDLAGGSGTAEIVTAAFSSETTASFLKSSISEITWKVNDIRKGKKSAQAVLDFQYADSLNGTVEITMLKEGREWKISSARIASIHIL